MLRFEWFGAWELVTGLHSAEQYKHVMSAEGVCVGTYIAQKTKAVVSSPSLSRIMGAYTLVFRHVRRYYGHAKKKESSRAEPAPRFLSGSTQRWEQALYLPAEKDLTQAK